jgi:hypothetical protein
MITLRMRRLRLFCHLSIDYSANKTMLPLGKDMLDNESDT